MITTSTARVPDPPVAVASIGEAGTTAAPTTARSAAAAALPGTSTTTPLEPTTSSAPPPPPPTSAAGTPTTTAVATDRSDRPETFSTPQDTADPAAPPPASPPDPSTPTDCGVETLAENTFWYPTSLDLADWTPGWRCIITAGEHGEIGATFRFTQTFMDGSPYSDVVRVVSLNMLEWRSTAWPLDAYCLLPLGIDDAGHLELLGSGFHCVGNGIA